MKGRMQVEHDEFSAQLRAAFPPLKVDATGAFSAWGKTYSDASEYARQLDGNRWDQWERDYLDLRSDALGFLGTEHLVAVLPAYLDLLATGGSFSQVPYTLLLLLTPPSAGKRGTPLGQKRFDALVEALSPSQRSAVAAALHAFATRYAETPFEGDARFALDKLWSQFEQVEG
jgi:hypothetical protein